eukprot:5476187-Amphidinium_carterae.1
MVAWHIELNSVRLRNIVNRGTLFRQEPTAIQQTFPAARTGVNLQGQQQCAQDLLLSGLDCRNHRRATTNKV